MDAARPPSSEVLPDVWLDARRALWMPVPAMLVVADLHWGYVASHRARGNLLPAWGDGDIEARLRALQADYRPREMVWLGDSLHTLAGREAAERFIAESPGTLMSILPGNHDLRWERAGKASISRGGYFLHHGDLQREVPAGQVEVIGHHHPAVSWYDGAGGRLKLPALVASPRRLIMPAFSPWAAGTPWNSKLRPDECLWAVSPRRIFQIPFPMVRPGQERD
jgi:uncharacterized protein